MTGTSISDYNLLHVEDNEFDAAALRRALSKLGIRLPVIRTRDGVDALAKLRSDTVTSGASPTQTIILLDINMPRMNGHEFLHELRDDPRLKQTPVFILTTSDQPIDIQRAYERNVAGYIVKPFSHGSYLEQIRQWADYLSIIELPRANFSESSN